MSAMVENVGLNETERLVYHLCRKSFLSLWSYANPQGKTPGKELCDILVVCEPDIIILSVKDVCFNEEGNEKVNQTRWFKRAIEESVKQIYTGARATGTAMTHMAATTTSKVHFHGVANAIRAPSAFNSGYHPAAQITWKTAKINAQSAAAYPHMLDCLYLVCAHCPSPMVKKDAERSRWTGWRD